MLIAGTQLGSLAGDLAETYFVLFMTKTESCITRKGFSMWSNDKCLNAGRTQNVSGVDLIQLDSLIKHSVQKVNK